MTGFLRKRGLLLAYKERLSQLRLAAGRAGNKALRARRGYLDRVTKALELVACEWIEQLATPSAAA